MNPIKLHVEDGLTTREVAQKMGWSDSRAYRFLKKAGVVRNKSEAIRGERHFNYKGGHVGKSGHKFVWHKGKLTTEHRVVMEQYLGRKLLRSEIVHHIDHNKLNNSVENLQMVTLETHQKFHAVESEPKYCEICRKRFTRPAYTSLSVWNRRRFCSKTCKHVNHSKFMTEHNGLHPI